VLSVRRFDGFVQAIACKANALALEESTPDVIDPLDGEVRSKND
jgi:hypothetical protein